MMGWQVLASKININNMKIFNCPKCEKSVIETEEQLIICDGFCQQKFHRFCANLSIEQLRLLQISKNCVWRCNPCNTLYHKCLRYEMEKSIMNKFDKNAEVNDMCFKEFNTRLNGVEILLNKNTSTAKANSPPSHQEQPYKIIFNRKAIIITGTIIVLTILIGILIITTSYIFNSSTHKIDENSFNGSLNIIKRKDWMARPANGVLASQKLPLHRVIISHTASDGCDTRESCDYRVQVIQNFHINSFGWDDIAYNFLIGGDGFVYEGRGWDKQGAHTKGYNTDSLGISFIGTFIQSAPTSNQLKAAQLLIDEGVRLRKLVPYYKLFGARQLGATESPGEALYKIVKTWPHWSKEI